ncbi:MAG: transposase [candidate division WOR-3 bacterium]
MSTNKRYSPIQKMEILREHLDNHVSISDLSDRFQVSPTMIYYWKKQLFEKAVTLFKNNKKDQLKFQELHDQLQAKDAIIAEIVADNIRLKKKLTGEP